MTKKKDISLTKSEALSKSWRKRKDFIEDEKGKGTLHNVWRSKVFTKKGKAIGFPESWKKYKSFKEEVGDGFVDGKVLIRIDSSKPYSKENVLWGEKGDENRNRCIVFTYKGVEKHLYEWCCEFDLNYNGVIQRYHVGKNYSEEEILFGKRYTKRRKINDHTELNSEKEIRAKASKMIAQYKLKDRKKGFKSDVDIEFLIDSFSKNCVYCGCNERIGLDRVDNGIGHLKNNCVPSCYRCNVTRGDRFTFDEMIDLAKVIRKIDEQRKNT